VEVSWSVGGIGGLCKRRGGYIGSRLVGYLAFFWGFVIRGKDGGVKACVYLPESKMFLSLIVCGGFAIL